MEREPKKITSKAYRCYCRFLTPDTEFDEYSDYINNTIKRKFPFHRRKVKDIFIGESMLILNYMICQIKLE